jgi:hypothetical protein
MAKTMIQNKLGAKTSTFYVPASVTVAQTFAEGFLEGEYAGYSLESTSGSDVAVSYNQVTVVGSNDLGRKVYLNLAVKATKTEDEIYTALTGLTLNGVKFDNIAITSMRSVA